MTHNLQAEHQALLKRAAEAPSLEAIENLRIEVVGKKGLLTGWMKALGDMTEEERRTQGAQLNTFKKVFIDTITKQRQGLEQAALDRRLAQERLDTTLPPPPHPLGRIHPLSQATAEIISIFGQWGFTVVEGPDIEDDFHNFTALNVGSDHPARSSQDTFYLPSSSEAVTRLLRTHTSTVQVRTLKSQKPPLRILAPGRVFRSDWDATHTPMFHQVEGLVIEPNIHMGHLKGCLEHFCRVFFEMPQVPVRFRPSFFPFTEPSAEVDIGSHQKGGQLRIGPAPGSTHIAPQDWLEILGCGMVHPQVLENCGLDSSLYQGFAFGMGVERVAMLKYGISDLREFFINDQRWLAHYGFTSEEGRL